MENNNFHDYMEVCNLSHMNYQNVLDLINHLKTVIPYIKWSLSGEKDKHSEYKLKVPAENINEAKLIMDVYIKYKNVQEYKKRKEEAFQKQKNQEEYLHWLKQYSAIVKDAIDIYENEDFDFQKDFSLLHEKILRLLSFSNILSYSCSGKDMFIEKFNGKKLDFEPYNKFHYYRDPYNEATSAYDYLDYILLEVFTLLKKGLSYYDKGNYDKASYLWKNCFDINYDTGNKVIGAISSLFAVKNKFEYVSFEDELIPEGILLEVKQEEQKPAKELTPELEVILEEGKQEEEKSEEELDSKIEEIIKQEKKKEKQNNFIKELYAYLLEYLCFLDIQFNGIKFSNQKISTDKMADAIGIKDEDIKESYRDQWSIFKNEVEIKKISDKLINEFNIIKERNLIKVRKYHWVLLESNREKWEREVECFKDKFISSDENNINILDEAINRSKNKFMELLINTFKNAQISEGKSISSEELEKKRVEYTKELDKKFQKVYNAYKKIDIEISKYNISEDMLKDKDFCFAMAVESYNKDEELASKFLCLSDRGYFDMENEYKNKVAVERRRVFERFEKLFLSTFKSVEPGNTELKLFAYSNSIIALSKDKNYAAITDSISKNIKVVDLNTLEVIKIFNIDERKEEFFSYSINDISFSYDSKSLAILVNNNTIIVWQFTKYDEIMYIDSADDMLYNIVFSPETNMLIAGGNKIHIYNLQKYNGTAKEVYPLAGPFYHSRVSPSGDTMLVSCKSEDIFIFDIKTNKLINYFSSIRDLNIIDVDFAADSDLVVASYSDKRFRIWLLSTQNISYCSDIIPGLRLARLISENSILVIANNIFILNLKDKNKMEITQGINFFKDSELSSLEQTALLGYYFGFTGECFK